MEVQKYYLFYKDELILPAALADKGDSIVYFTAAQIQELTQLLTIENKLYFRSSYTPVHEVSCAIKLSAAITMQAPEQSTHSLTYTLCNLSLRTVSVRLDAATAHAVLTGYARLNWQASTRYCSYCSSPLVDDPKEFIENAARSCPACKSIFYPRISPAMIVLIKKENTILLAHNANFLPGRFSLLAGFLEAGETIEAAVEREVYEEAKIKIKNICYFRSQAWPFPNSLMIGFIAEWASGEIEVDGKEIIEANWYTKDQLPEIPPPGSISRAMIDSFIFSEAN